MKRIAFFTCLSAFFTANAQTDTTELLPVEVRTIRASATAPFAKTNINRAEIDKRNMGQDLPFLLNQTPSVVVNSDAGNGVGYTGIRIRGTDATRVNVTLNGIPFNDPESSGTFFVDLPDFLSSVSSIQVQRGVGTSSNGAGSFGGTINLSTNAVNRQPYFESNNSYGSFNTLKNTIKAGSGLLGDHFTTDLRLSRITSDGYIDRATSDLKSFYFSSAYVADKTSLRLNVFSGTEKTYQAWNGVSEADLANNRTINYAGTEKPGSPYKNETDNYQQDHYQFFFNQKINAKLNFNTGLFYIRGKGYYEQYKANRKYADFGMTEPATGLTRTDLIRQLWLDNDYYGNIFSLQHSSAGTEVTIGGAITKYVGGHFGEVIWAKNGMLTNNHRWYDVNADKNDFSIYGKWQQKLPGKWQFFTDLQLRTVNHEINGFRDNPSLKVGESYTFFNPKIGITWQNDNFSAFASYSIANKEPNRDDFEASPIDQPRPERLNDLELGVEKKSRNFSWAAGLYYMKYKDQLVLTGKINDVGAYTRSNIENSYRLGTELQADATFTTWLKANANLTLSRNKISDFKEFIDDYDTGNQKQNQYDETDISFSPGVIGGINVTLLPFKNFSFELQGKYVGKQYLDNTSNDARKLDPFYTQDARFVYTFGRKWLKKIDLVFQVNNLFNEMYEPNGYTFSYYYNNQLTTENFYFPMAGRNWVVGVNVKL